MGQSLEGRRSLNAPGWLSFDGSQHRLSGGLWADSSVTGAVPLHTPSSTLRWDPKRGLFFLPISQQSVHWALACIICPQSGLCRPWALQDQGWRRQIQAIGSSRVLAQQREDGLLAELPRSKSVLIQLRGQGLRGNAYVGLCKPHRRDKGRRRGQQKRGL